MLLLTICLWIAKQSTWSDESICKKLKKKYSYLKYLNARNISRHSFDNRTRCLCYQWGVKINWLTVRLINKELTTVWRVTWLISCHGNDAAASSISLSFFWQPLTKYMRTFWGLTTVNVLYIYVFSCIFVGNKVTTTDNSFRHTESSCLYIFHKQANDFWASEAVWWGCWPDAVISECPTEWLT